MCIFMGEKMQTCTHCGEKKPLAEYYWHSKDQSYFKKCKGCCIALAKKRNREKWEHIVRQRREYRRTEHGRMTVKAQRRRGIVKNRHKFRARQAARDKHGPASKKLCVHCGSQAHGWHHHKGYDWEHRLDVIPLCWPCHNKAERLQRS